MNPERTRKLLEQIRGGEVSVDEAMDRLRNLPFEDLQFAKIDHHRAMRKGYPEAVYCEGKAPDHILEIARAVVSARENLLLTRVPAALAPEITALAPGHASHHERARCVTFVFDPPAPVARHVAVVSAGTSDMPVAEEAAVTAEFMGSPVRRVYDAGVAGIHRLFEHAGALHEAGAIVVAAGMEGALASVVGGMVSAPVIAVPTSVGYGASFGGLAALLGMLNTCAPGVAVVNIDNGFGAGYFAAAVNRRTQTAE